MEAKMSRTGSLKFFGYTIPLRSARAFWMVLGLLVACFAYVAYLVCHALSEASGVPPGLVALMVGIVTLEVTVEGGHRLAILPWSTARGAVLNGCAAFAAYFYLEQGEQFEGLLLAAVVAYSVLRGVFAWMRAPRSDYEVWRMSEDARLAKKLRDVEDIPYKDVSH
jgi:hypothetical protein